MKKHKLGISIYPEYQETKDVLEYVTKAHRLGYERIFSSLLQVEKVSKDEILKKLTIIFNYCKNLGFEVVLDVAPNIFNILEINLPNVEFFEKLGVTTIRFDEGFDYDIGYSIIKNSKINIEVNISTDESIASEIVKSNIPMNRIIGSHNFYPQKYSGLDYDYFIKMSKLFNSIGLRNSAFVTSQNPKATVGPWPGNDTLCSLEDHRNLPILVQAQHLLLSGYIDDISIGNANASDDELNILSSIDPDIVQLEVERINDLSSIEEKILFEFNNHFRRGDLTSYFIRSTMSRVEYSDESIKARKIVKKQLPGEIYILNDEFARYKGELHIILKEMPYDYKKNYVGKIKDSNEILLKYIDSWKKIKLIE